MRCSDFSRPDTPFFVLSVRKSAQISNPMCGFPHTKCVDSQTGYMKTTSEELYERSSEDLRDRSEWAEDIDRISRMRMGERSRNLSYPNAPAPVVRIIDENVRRATAQIMRIFDDQRYFATFIPLNQDAFSVKEEVELAFDLLLKMLLDVRATIEIAVDTANECGLSYIGLKPDDEKYKRVLRGDPHILPDIEYIHPVDIIVPTTGKKVRDLERYTRIYRYSPMTVRQLWKDNEWDHLDEILAHSRETNHESSRGSDENSGYEPMIGINTAKSSSEMVVIWQTYYIDENGRRRVSVYSPDAPQFEAANFPWTWTGTNEDKPWQMVELRFENRKLELLDSRGIGHLTKDNQHAATQFKTVRMMQIDFMGRPILESTNNMHGAQTFSWIPGSTLPPGVRPARFPQVDPVFNVSEDIERNEASRLVGSTAAALSSTERGKDAKTATEVNQSTQTSNLLSLNNALSFASSVGEVFSLQWDWIRRDPVLLPVISDEQSGVLPEEVFLLPYIVRSSISSRNYDPNFKLAQLNALQPYLLNEKVDVTRVIEYAARQVDPFLAEELIPEGQENQIMQGLQQLTTLVEKQQADIQGIQGYIQAVEAESESNELQDEVDKIFQKATRGAA